jgi:hypothetical protein
MKLALIETLKQASFDTSFEGVFTRLAIRLGTDGKPMPAGRDVFLKSGEKTLIVNLDPVSRLWVGNRQPLDVQIDPSSPYIRFFATMEMAAFDYCNCTNSQPTDEEFERLYRQLRRRPDGTDNNPLFSYLQAAAALYLSLTDTSKAEYEAVLQTLSRSARTFGMGPVSRNYIAQLYQQFQQ